MRLRIAKPKIPSLHSHKMEMLPWAAFGNKLWNAKNICCVRLWIKKSTQEIEWVTLPLRCLHENIVIIAVAIWTLRGKGASPQRNRKQQSKSHTKAALEWADEKLERFQSLRLSQKQKWADSFYVFFIWSESVNRWISIQKFIILIGQAKAVKRGQVSNNETHNDS